VFTLFPTRRSSDSPKPQNPIVMYEMKEASL